MKHPIRAAAALACIGLFLALAGSARAQAGAPPHTQTRTAVSTRATGTFEVQLAPQETAATLGRMSLDKQFHGDLEGTSKGEMLAVQGGVQGSAGYVALEQVTGTLHGRAGTFYLQHTGTMDRGAPSLSITVVPDTGTGELAGLTGRMNIVIEAGKHSYELDYTLPGGS
jgi:hypothetical protein